MRRWSTRASVNAGLAPFAALAGFVGTVWCGANLLGWVFGEVFDRPYGFAGVIVSLVHVSCYVALVYGACRLAWHIHRVVHQGRAGDDIPHCGGCGYNLTGNVSGRCPECGMDDMRFVLDRFVRRERAHRVKWRAMVILGAPLSLLAAVTLASLLWLAACFFGRFDAQLPDVRWMDLFVVLAVITVPLLYHLEMRTGGNYRADLTKGGLPPGRGYMLAQTGVGLFAATAASHRAISTVFVEVFLSGPRLVLTGFHQLKLARRVRLADSAPAARIVSLLASRDSGLDTSALLGEGATMERLMPVLAYLAFYRWVGVGDGWARIWLDSDARRLLAGSSPR